jgi:hypothetical protein
MVTVMGPGDTGTGARLQQSIKSSQGARGPLVTACPIGWPVVWPLLAMGGRSWLHLAGLA